LQESLRIAGDRFRGLPRRFARRPRDLVNFATPTDDAVRISFNTDEVAASFTVDVERRTIAGLTVPWGKVARNGLGKWRFGENSLRFSTPSRVKLNRDHDFEQLIGRATTLKSTAAGLFAKFKIAEGVEGDRALALAQDEILDGFSIEIDFDDSAGDEWFSDPSDESVRFVRQGTLRGVALTGMPAFDDARVTSVKAMRDGGHGMTAPVKATKAAAAGTAPDPNGDNFTTFMTTLAEKIAESQKAATEGLTDKIGEMLSEGVKAALENLHDPQTDGPQPVRAARWTVTREAPVYTLDGRGPCLVRDAWHAQMSRDDDAIERIRKFRKQSEEMAKVAHDQLHMQVAGLQQFATSTTVTNPQIIPPGYRPDLFIPMLDQGRPFANALSQGVISNATPFVVPVFVSATGATADHVENVNPTDGTLAFTTKTVTPGAISGLLKLTREIVDSSNPAIDQIALAAMRESYARQTEAKIYTLLNGSSGQGGTITAGLVPSGAQVSTATGTAAGGLAGAALLDAIRAGMAVYPFRRFAAPNLSLMSQEATVAFAGAKDTTGRPLLPSVGATNTAGLGNALSVGWFVDGLAHIPAWAITGNAAGDADTFMLNRADAWIWESPLLTFRYEERSGPAVIDLALFGYFAVHLLRPVGLSSVRLTVT
jgi:HK97 family phage prohead protease/HK97 family phage major capsid protein